MTAAAHCESCDTWGCAGFTTPRATPEPVPALRAERPASDEARRRYVAEALKAVDGIRRELKGKGAGL